jgi:hypothetical protein
MSYEHLRPLVVRIQAKLSPDEMYVLSDLLKGIERAERERCLKIIEDVSSSDPYGECAIDEAAKRIGEGT